MNEFQLDGPLPSSTLLLESSAGTGKTYTIAGLAVRYLAEAGLEIGELLLVTFGSQAAAELRSRVFEAIERCARLLRAHASGTPVPEDEPVAAHLAGTVDVDEAVARLERALDQFDSAVILTIHAFAQRTLRELGILGDHDATEQLAQADDVLDEVSADLYVARYADEHHPPFEWWQARMLGRSAGRSTLPLEPADSEEARFAAAVRERFEERRRGLGLVTFDDLVTRLRDVLRDATSGPAARDWLQHRYRVVLVDEFQDTDPEQWAVVESAFAGPGRATILIGDPKQSIYGFRSADLPTYERARATAEVQCLGVNHRSDEGVVHGVVELLEGVTMGAEDIQVHPVRARHGSRFEAPVQERVWVRRVAGKHPLPTVLDDLVWQVHHLLGTHLVDGDERQAVRPDDIAVLVRVGATAAKVTEHLQALGYPAVQFAGSEVWDQPAAEHWRWLLRALSPAGEGARRVLALTDLVGATITDLTSTSTATALWDMLHRAAAALEADGPSAALDVVREGTRLEARLLPTPDGARTLTDLAHIAELLDATGHRDPTMLLQVLDEQPGADGEAELRLTTDAPAVKVMTLHAAKGLEFPIVLLPDLSGMRLILNRPFPFVRDGERVLWMRPEQPESSLGQDVARQLRDEELRLLYVGLTRAKHLAVLWHAQEEHAELGAVSAALLRDRPTDTLRAAHHFNAPLPQLDRVRIIEAAPDRPPRAAEPAPDDGPLRLATFTREVDRHWRRTSYSGLTHGLHDAPSGADEQVELDELRPDPTLARPVPMESLPAGAAFGTLVHEALELLDWAPDGLTGRVAAVVERLAVTFSEDEAATLRAGLEAVVTTPLRPLTGQSLSEIPVAERLPELDFDLPMRGDDTSTVAALAQLLARHLPDDDPLAAYPARLAASEASAHVLRGMLTGSIDAVLRTDDGRFLVVDYKTNRLAPSASHELTLGHYAPRPMAEAMMAAHYPLQATLYSAALHRYLSLRLPGYRPEEHLGGVGYLFVRGMAGPDTPIVDGHACGVFAWHPSAELVVAVSNLLGGTHA